MTISAETLTLLLGAVGVGGPIGAWAMLRKEHREESASAPELLQSWIESAAIAGKEAAAARAAASAARDEAQATRRELADLRREVEAERGVLQEAMSLLAGPVTTIIRWIESGGQPPAPGEAEGLSDRITALVERIRS